MTHGGAHVAVSGWAVVVGAAVAASAGYGWAAVALRSRTGRRWGTGRTAAFAIGVLLAAVGLAPPLGELAGSPAGEHMARHVLLGMVAPLGLVLGAPVTLALSVLPVPARRRATALLRSRPVAALSHPLTAASLHVGGLYALYLTPLHALSRQHAAVGAAVLAHVLLAGCLFAWSLVGPERAARSPGIRWRVAVLVAASTAHGHLARLLYLRAPELPVGTTDAVADLRAAAWWMYYAGDVAEVALAVVLFAAWYRRAGRARASRAAQAAA